MRSLVQKCAKSILRCLGFLILKFGGLMEQKLNGTTIYLPKELHRRVKMIASAEELTFSEQVILALEKLVEDPKYRKIIEGLEQLRK